MSTSSETRSVLARDTRLPEHFVPHAATRWARIVAGVLTSPVDLRTLEDWGRHVAVSRGAIKTWCGLAGTSARRSLLLARMLRAVHYRRRGISFENTLNIRDGRTLRKLFDAAGRPGANDDLRDVVMKQRLVVDAELMATLVRLLEDEEGASNPSWHAGLTVEHRPHDASTRPS